MQPILYENEADLTVNTFTGCIVDYIFQIEGNQNKNSVVVNVKNVIIYQKYLKREHIHAAIRFYHANLFTMRLFEAIMETR